MAIMRVEHKNCFTTISNTLINDSRLSFKALGVAIFFLAKPDNWSINISYLISKNKEGKKIRKEGKEAIGSALKELEQYGYLTKQQIRDEGGHFKDWEYCLREHSSMIEDSPKAGFPQSGFPQSGNPPLINTDLSNTDLNKKDQDLSILTNGPQIRQDFDIFWKKYPRKEAEPRAYARWIKLKPSGEVLSRMLEAIDEQIEKRRHQAENNFNGWSEDWPMGATWLNSKRWNDEAYIDPIEAARLKGLEDWANNKSKDDNCYEARYA